MSAATAQYRGCRTDPVTHDPAEPLHLYYIVNAARPSTTTAALTMLESRLSTAPAALTLQIMDQHIQVSCWYHLWLSTVMHNIDSTPQTPPSPQNVLPKCGADAVGHGAASPMQCRHNKPWCRAATVSLMIQATAQHLHSTADAARHGSALPLLL